MDTTAHPNSLMEEAIKLARDGELGNSDAIRLLQVRRRPEEINEVLRKFAEQLTREAKGKLTLETFAPLPGGIDNQRYEPLFDRYAITGKTYTTASGTVVLNEVQYYNGEMAQLYGTCTNLARVREALAGSGYKPMTIREAGGQESAIAQFWAHQLTDTSLRPYNAMFLIVVAVKDSTPAHQATIIGDANGASSILTMFDGSFDRVTNIYENRALLFYVRLLDSTRTAIEVGRERMGTDKRPGTIEVARRGRQLTFSVRNDRHAVATISFMPPEDPMAYLPELAKAAATAGIPLPQYPRGTEHVYPSVARIGREPVVCWEWRTDLLPQLQPSKPDTAVFDANSEEGRMLIDWGFKPRVLAYIPNVRGVVTGVPEQQAAAHPPVDSATAARFARRPATAVLTAYTPGPGRGQERLPASSETSARITEPCDLVARALAILDEKTPR